MCVHVSSLFEDIRFKTNAKLHKMWHINIGIVQNLHLESTDTIQECKVRMKIDNKFQIDLSIFWFTKYKQLLIY